MNDYINIKKLTDHLNACKHPRKIFNALSALASSTDVQNTENSREAIVNALRNIDFPKNE